MDKNIFIEIQNDDIPTDVKRISQFLSLSFDENNNDELEKIVKFAYILYIYGKLELALKIVDGISECEFDGNYDSWTWVDAALVLAIRIRRAFDQLNDVSMLKNKILSPLSIGNDMQVKVKNRVYKRFLEGEALSFDKVQEAMISNRKDAEAARRLSNFIKLMKISEMGGSEIYSVDKAESEMKDNEVKINILLKEIDLASIF
ncbi:hypothetical protein Z042_25190 [Chania multitudinisentens RB-25]|uniref:Uncharacterized protein n=1 Tax=Chania multitudinisentens RB-25 TaxID=1441930 RepID=W0LH12_9GAMM|nr:DUF6707 family protein [Chania multitudinisentens]AHG23031.1 hypothetical protein Z042_25190 [Chania multitudinisentens RB-25]